MKLKKLFNLQFKDLYQKNLTYKGELYPHEAYFLMQNENSLFS